jgi:hypothetical protein
MGETIETVAYLFGQAYNFPKIRSVLFWTVVHLGESAKSADKSRGERYDL